MAGLCAVEAEVVVDVALAFSLREGTTPPSRVGLVVGSIDLHGHMLIGAGHRSGGGVGNCCSHWCWSNRCVRVSWLVVTDGSVSQVRAHNCRRR